MMRFNSTFMFIIPVSTDFDFLEFVEI